MGPREERLEPTAVVRINSSHGQPRCHGHSRSRRRMVAGSWEARQTACTPGEPERRAGLRGNSQLGRRGEFLCNQQTEPHDAKSDPTHAAERKVQSAMAGAPAERGFNTSPTPERGAWPTIFEAPAMGILTVLATRMITPPDGKSLSTVHLDPAPPRRGGERGNRRARPPPPTPPC